MDPGKNPASDPEWVRQIQQRVNALERKQTLRLGDWVFVAHPDTGVPMLVKPGTDPLNVGEPLAEVIDLGAVRGFITKTEVAAAITQNQSNSMSTVPDTMGSMDLATANAQYAADSANAAAARIEALLNAGDTGYSFIDTMDRPAAMDLGVDYEWGQSGGAAGQYGTDGLGNAKSRSTDGATARTFSYRHVVPTNTDNQTVTVTLEAPPRSNGGGGIVQSEIRLCARESEDRATRVEARIYHNAAYLGWRDAGVWSEFPGGSIGVGQAAGDRWDLLVGSPLGARHTVLLRNGLQLLEYNDLGAITSMGVDYRSGGFDVVAGTTIQHWVVTLQVHAPTVQQFIVADRFF